ncbi:MAG TPA: hypothetical protein VKY74_04825 [Chloroflexia bacterium]|nr:hypothetical protein [Chloroflexia bacterium]
MEKAQPDQQFWLGSLRGVELSPDERSLVVIADPYDTIWDRAAGRVIWSAGDGTPPPAELRSLVESGGQTARRDADADEGNEGSVASPGGDRAVVPAGNNTLRLFNPATDETVATLAAHRGYISATVFRADGGPGHGGL